jgi:hypothetical protein
MYDAKDMNPSPVGVIDELLVSGDSSARPYKIFIGHNLGHRVFLLSIPMHDFYAISNVANERGRNGEPVAQRKLDETHARKLAIYMLKGLVAGAVKRRELKKQPELEALNGVSAALGPQPYLSLQPIVANIRECDPGGANIPGVRMMTREEEIACFKVMLAQQHILWVIDGQHRRKAMSMVFEFLDAVTRGQKYPKKNSLYPAKTFEPTPGELQAWNECSDVARSFCTVTAEIHLGLGVDEERQMFHDLNNLGKKVESSLALQFDSANPVNQFIKEVLFDDVLGWEPLEKDIADWHDDIGALTRKDVVAINAQLFLNKTNISGATPEDVESRKEIALRFWSAVRDIPGFGQPNAKLTTVAAQPVVLKALARLVFSFAFSKRRPEQGSTYVEKLLTSIPSIDFSHANPMWRYYELPTEQRAQQLPGLEAYLPSDDEGFNRDIGNFDSVARVMRFGAKHNDIFPILADMIRWKLGFPSRHIDTPLE